MDVCVDQTLLQRVLCIFLVAQQRECGAKEFGAVANEDWRKRIGISCECALNEPPFFGCRARINRLARACRYLWRQVRPTTISEAQRWPASGAPVLGSVVSQRARGRTDLQPRGSAPSGQASGTGPGAGAW